MFHNKRFDHDLGSKTVTVLNTSILTSFGTYTYDEISLQEARYILEKASNYVSAVGHKATSEVLTELLCTPVIENRIQYSQQPGDIALVFKLNTRIPEGVILSREELEKMSYTFGVLVRVA